MTKPAKRPAALTTLAKHSAYIKAIGMFVVEFTNLEIYLGDLVGSLLHISIDNGRILYLTPQTGYGRISILENLRSDGKNLFQKDSKDDKELTSIIREARRLMDIRHRIIHHSWGLASNATETLVAQRKTPFLKSNPFKPVTLAELERNIDDIRRLAHQVREAAEINYESWPPYSSPPKPSAQHRADRA